jgi:hypothetical protein
VTGTLTYAGKTVGVTGLGYHDHQWCNINPMVAWHHWLWGRMYTERYTIYISKQRCESPANYGRAGPYPQHPSSRGLRDSVLE